MTGLGSTQCLLPAQCCCEHCEQYPKWKNKEYEYVLKTETLLTKIDFIRTFSIQFGDTERKTGSSEKRSLFCKIGYTAIKTKR